MAEPMFPFRNGGGHGGGGGPLAELLFPFRNGGGHGGGGILNSAPVGLGDF